MYVWTTSLAPELVSARRAARVHLRLGHSSSGMLRLSILEQPSENFGHIYRDRQRN
jgi:hypothetical protein